MKVTAVGCKPNWFVFKVPVEGLNLGAVSPTIGSSAQHAHQTTPSTKSELPADFKAGVKVNVPAAFMMVSLEAVAVIVEVLDIGHAALKPH